MTIQIRKIVSLEDLAAIGRLRYEVYIREKGFDVSGADHESLTLIDELDAVSTVFGAFSGEEALATARVTPLSQFSASSPVRTLYDPQLFPYPECTHVVFSRLMVRRGNRGSSLCMSMVGAAYEHARKDGVEVVHLDCAARELPLYEALGCRRYKDAVGDPEYGLNIPMVQLTGDLQHLNRVRSPLRSKAKAFASHEHLSGWFERQFPRFARPCSLRLMSPLDRRRLMRDPASGRVWPIFAGFSQPELDRLLHASAVVDVEADNQIFRRDHKDPDIYVVLRGSLGVVDDEERGARLLGPGGVLGGVQPAGRRRSGTAAITLAPTRLLLVSAEQWGSLSSAEDRPRLARV